MKRRLVLALPMGLLLAGMATWAAAADPSYEKDIVPLFKKFCVKCHGPSTAKAGLRLDSPTAILKGGDGGKSVKPGNGAGSMLYEMMISEESDLRMPPKGARPTKAELEAVKKWIDQGAKMPEDQGAAIAPRKSDHWAFQPVVRPETPAVKQRDWVRNEIDEFILARLEKAGIAPSPEADRVTLARRLYLDLLGLPPPVSEVDTFVADQRPDAYERLVDRVLASPHYGERQARHWLDLARYADSNGFTIDGKRNIWKYRDWVIDALNRDLPFDQFTIEQLAGDMLPKATNDQLIATGFHRNTLINEEGGTDAEQFRVEAVVDRVNTTGQVWLGLTVGCAQCHTHKYDPITQREYYQLFAFLNNADEPNLAIPTPQQGERQQELKKALSAAEKRVKEHDQSLAARQGEWEQQVAAEPEVTWHVVDPTELATLGSAVIAKVSGSVVMVSGEIPDHDQYTLAAASPIQRITGVRLEALVNEILPKQGPGLATDGTFALSELELALRPEAGGKAVRAAFAAAVAAHSPKKHPIEHSIDGKPATGWSSQVELGSPNVDRTATFVLKEDLAPAGRPLEFKLVHRLGEKAALGRFRLSVTDAPRERLRIPPEVRAILAKAAGERSEDERELAAAVFSANDTARRKLAEDVTRLKKELEQLNQQITTTMVVRERAQPRVTHVHIRGDFLRHGDIVEPNVPEVLPPLPPNVTKPTRLDLARWLVDPANPLTPRVTMNRLWQQHFRAGLVETENDFGTQGSLPTHPELLDWLAAEFLSQDWSQKAMHKLIVLSATYRQASHIRTDLNEIDARNKLLARQERVRLEAETIRDVTLAASGLLSAKIGGPGVFPPQPEGLYKFTQRDKAWKDSAGEDRYRRGMYTYFWRSSPYPFLTTFDAPEGNVSCTRRVRSNTPLQALTLANDRSLFELARGMAVRIMKEGPADDAARAEYAFRLCLSRKPNDRERAKLVEFCDLQRQAYASDSTAARLAAPAKTPEPLLAQAAAWTTVARVLLNLDEFITRE